MTIVDFSTNVNKVRLLIADIDDTDQIFTDAAITAYIDLSAENNLYRAAALALLAIAVNETLVQKRIKLLDLSTDGPAEAEALRNLAKEYRAIAAEEEVEGAVDFAELIISPAQWQEFTYKQSS